MNKILVLVMIASLSGCASFDVAKMAVASNGAKTMDEARETAEWTLCNGISVGAWRRAYAENPQKAEAWAKLCTQAKGVPQ